MFPKDLFPLNNKNKYKTTYLMAYKGKKIQKIDDREDYEKCGLKSIMEDVEETKKQGIESGTANI